MGPAVRRVDHLRCRYGRWSVRLRVPAHLVATIGRTHLVRSLDTENESSRRSSNAKRSPCRRAAAGRRCGSRPSSGSSLRC
ncbi:DUF6538 domain-containing protein [Methylobacterium mesophilicum]|uniref:DUF6538 domain-containing protein n=1 Tax=Methylobacterium mesophilicum TaxID=39956 RepID=UPI003AF45D70